MTSFLCTTPTIQCHVTVRVSGASIQEFDNGVKCKKQFNKTSIKEFDRCMRARPLK